MNNNDLSKCRQQLMICITSLEIVIESIKEKGSECVGSLDALYSAVKETHKQLEEEICKDDC